MLSIKVSIGKACPFTLFQSKHLFLPEPPVDLFFLRRQKRVRTKNPKTTDRELLKVKTFLRQNVTGTLNACEPLWRLRTTEGIDLKKQQGGLAVRHLGDQEPSGHGGGEGDRKNPNLIIKSGFTGKSVDEFFGLGVVNGVRFLVPRSLSS